MGTSTGVGPLLPSKAVSSFAIEVLTSTTQLRALEREWVTLWHADPHSTPFQSPQWLIPWWEHVGEGDLHCFAARDPSHRLIALLPLYRYLQPTTGERHLLTLGAGTSDYLDGLFDPSSASALATTLLQHLAASRDPHPATPGAPSPEARMRLWDRAFLSQLRPESPLLLQADAAGWSTYPGEPCSVIRVTGREQLRTKLRGNLRRYTRRAQSEGTLRLHVASTVQEAAASLEVLIDLHTRRWRGLGQPGVLASPRVQAHHRASVPKLQAAGMLQMLELRLNEHTVAVLYGLRDASGRHLSPDSDAIFLYLIGFDPDYAELSPGSLLLAAVLDQCGEASIPLMDLLRGGEAYKELWGAYTVPTFGITLAGQQKVSAKLGTF